MKDLIVPDINYQQEIKKCKTMEGLYGIDVPPFMISKITDKVVGAAAEWQSRMLDEVYPIVYMDAMHFKVRDDSIVSYVLGHSNNNQLVFETFDLAIKNNPMAKPLFHSDRGFQYTNKVFK